MFYLKDPGNVLCPIVNFITAWTTPSFLKTPLRLRRGRLYCWWLIPSQRTPVVFFSKLAVSFLYTFTVPIRMLETYYPRNATGTFSLVEEMSCAFTFIPAFWIAFRRISWSWPHYLSTAINHANLFNPVQKKVPFMSLFWQLSVVVHGSFKNEELYILLHGIFLSRCDHIFYRAHALNIRICQPFGHFWKEGF